MTSPFRFDGRTIPETEEERRKRLLREAMEAAQFGQTFAAGGQPQMLPAMKITPPRNLISSVADEANQEQENVTRSFLAALEEEKRRRERLQEMVQETAERPKAEDILLKPRAQRALEQTEVAPVQADVTRARRGQSMADQPLPQATISAQEPSGLSKALNVLAQPAVQVGLAGMRFREATESAIGRESAAERARQTQALVQEALGPKSGLAQAVAVPSAFAGEAVPYIAAGGGIPGLLRSAAITGITSQRPGGSTVEALGELTGSQGLQRLAESPLRTAADVALDVGINLAPGAVRGLTQGFRETARATRGGAGTTRALVRQAAQNTAEGARQIGPTARAVGQQLAAEPLTTAALAAGLAGETVVPGVSALAAALPATTGGQFADRLFSRLGRAIDAAPFEKGTPQQWQAALSKGVAAGEREFTGIDEFLKGTDAKTLTKAEVRDAFEQGRIRLGEEQLRPFPPAEMQEMNKALTEAEQRLQEARLGLAEKYLQDRNIPALQEQKKALQNELVAVRQPAVQAYDEFVEKIKEIASRPNAGEYLGYDNPESRAMFLETAVRDALPRGRTLESIGLPPEDTNALRELQQRYEDVQLQVVDSEQYKRLYNQIRRVDDQIQDVYSRAGSYSRTQDIPELREYNALQEEIGGRLGAETKYGRYTQPGDRQNYREVVMTLDGQEVGQSPYRSGHWNIDNPLLHVRMSDRIVFADGKFEPALFVEEIQSDWHQAGRRYGYTTGNTAKQIDDIENRRIALSDELRALQRPDVTPQSDFTKAIEYSDRRSAIVEEYDRLSAELNKLQRQKPDAPFKKTPEWTELGLKRVIDEAVQGGYDRVVLVTGEQAANNFDLSRQISRLDWNTPDDGKTFRIFGDGQQVAADVPLIKLPDYVGKEIADKIVAASAERRRGSLEGVDLKIGGEGMRSFYDKLVPNTLRDLGKSMGLNIELEPVDAIQGRGQNLSFRITPEAREKIATEGMRLYDITGVAGEGLRQAVTRPGMAAAVGAGVGALTDEEDRFGGAIRGAFVGAGVGTAGKITAQQLLRARAALKASGFPQELADAYARASASIDFSGKAAQALARRAKGSFKQMAQRALAGYEDGVRALDRLAEGAEAAGMAPERSVATALDRALGSQATAARALANGVGVERGGVIDPITREIVNEPLEDVFKSLGGRPETNEQALTYVVALRRLGRYDKAAVQSPEAAAVVYGGDLATMEADRAVVTAFGERPEFVEFAGRLQQYLDSVGEYMVKSGVWSPEQYAAMRESDAFYIPFKRLLENVQGTVGRPMKAGVTPGQVTAGVKTFTGSRLALANPAEALGEYTAAAIARADKYRVGSTLIDTVNELGDTSLLTRIEATDPRARGVAQADAEAAFRTLGISEDEAGTMAELFRRVDKNNPVIWRNGPEGREYYLVNDPDLVNALETLNPENPGAAVRAMVGVLSPLKRATTAFATGYSPSFWLGVNLPRDIITAYAQNPNMTVGDMAVGFREAFKSIAGKSEMVERVTREGAGQVSQFGADPNVAALMRGIAPTTAGQQARSTVGAGITAPMRGLERVGRATEMPMRLAAARSAERTAAARGVSEAGQRALGSRAYSRATVDFRRKAGVGLERFFEQTVPFYGAAKKGGVAFARAVKNNPKAVSAAATAVVLGASLEHILGGGTMGGVFEGDEAARQEQTNRLAWDRARSIQLGDFKLALPQELAVVAAATRVALASLERDDPFAYQQLQESLLSAIPPIYSDIARGEVIAPFPVVRQLQEIAQNRSAFTGRPIVPESMTGAGVGRGVLPEQRRYPTTSPTFDVMASAARGMGFEQASPLQAEYLMRGITGRFTPALTAITDVAAQPMTGRESEGRVRESLMRQPLNPLSSFVVQPSRRTQAEEEFYKLRNEIEAAQGTYSRLDKQYQTAVERNDAAGEERVKREITRMRKDPRFEAVWQNTGARLEDKRAADPEYQTAFDKLKLADELLEDVRTQQELVQEAVANRRMSQAEARKRLDQLNLERSQVYRRAFDVLSKQSRQRQ